MTGVTLYRFTGAPRVYADLGGSSRSVLSGDTVELPEAPDGRWEAVGGASVPETPAQPAEGATEASEETE